MHWPDERMAVGISITHPQPKQSPPMTTTQTIFTPAEAATLEALYPDVDAFFRFFYLLSDRVQEDEVEEFADAMRFITSIRQRPYRFTRGCAWYETRVWVRHAYPHDMHECNNYIPLEMGDVGWAKEDTKLYPCPTSALTAFLIRWAELPLTVRTRLRSEWAGVEA